LSALVAEWGKDLLLLNEMIAPHVAQQPDKAAFRYMGEDLSFAALDRRSNQVANCLLAHGLEREGRVGLYLHRGLETPTGEFGIFKAGGAFVPLDPYAPLERIAYLIRETEMRHIITHHHLAKKMQDLVAMLEVPLTVIGLEVPLEVGQTISWGEIDGLDATVPDVKIIDTDLAYIIFTSGSTGTPKGIMHNHRSALAFVKNCNDAFGFTGEDKMAALSHLIFDMALNEYLCAPYLGATVVIVPDGYVRFPASLAKHLAEEDVTIFCAVPSLLISFLQSGTPQQHDLSKIRWILTGGEPLAPKYLTAGFEVMPNSRYGNLYGPAETNICSHHAIAPGQELAIDVIPIGVMTCNSNGIIVDDTNEPVADGAAGELVVASSSVMMGYWRDEARSEAAFFRAKGVGGQELLYLRTGDHVRRNSDGILEYIGRSDRQVKSRGYRVELDEVELALSANDGVIEAAAFQYQPDAGEHQIAAAVTLVKDCNLSVDDLNQSLRDRLPPYAIPQQIRILATFPRTQSGKIARRELTEHFNTES